MTSSPKATLTVQDLGVTLVIMVMSLSGLVLLFENRLLTWQP